MKMAILALSLFSFSAFAGVICANPTTGFYLVKGRIGYDLTVTSPYGPEFTPTYDGQVVPFALPQLQRESEIAKSLGNIIKVKFSEDGCIENDGLVKCTNGSSDNEEVENIRFYTTKVSEKSLVMNYDFLRLTLVMTIDGEQLHLSSRYSLDRCSF